MRLFVLATASVIALAACSPAPIAKEDVSKADPNAAEGTPAPPPDAAMRAAAAADAAAGVTPDGFTFHTNPKKIEVVHLPLVGEGVWSGQGYSDAPIFNLLDSQDTKLASGVKVHSVRFEMLASGNGRVVFEKRATDNLNDPVLEVRTVKFMIH